MRFPVVASFFFASALAVAQFPGATPVPRELRRGYDSIKIDTAKSILGYLAGPECAGRGSGQVGYQKAAEFVAKRFKEYGLKPGGDDGYFQYGTLYRTRTLSGSLTVGSQTISNGDGLNLGAVGNTVSLKGPVVVVRVKSRGSDLPEGLDLKGAIVLLSGPGVDGSIRTDLRQQNVAMVLNVRPTVPKVVESVRRSAGAAGRLTGTISEVAAKKLAESAGYTAPMTGDEGMDVPVLVAKVGEGSVEATGESGEVKVPNVIGVLPGTDPTLSAQVVGLGAHLDHLGTDGETTYPGADDDGSGSTAMLLIAKAMAKNGPKPKRTVVFMAFYGEEMGLLGSKFYADHPKFPLDTMVSHLQMDMVGRDSYGIQNGDSRRVDKVEENGDTMRLVGSKRISTELHNLILDQNKYVNFRFVYDSEDVYTRSDHYSFASKGVPIAFLFDGFTPDYHQPTDTIEKINWLKIANTAKLFYLTAIELANRPTAPAKDVVAAGGN